jgi:hypothetical protein
LKTYAEEFCINANLNSNLNSNLYNLNLNSIKKIETRKNINSSNIISSDNNNSNSNSSNIVENFKLTTVNLLNEKMKKISMDDVSFFTFYLFIYYYYYNFFLKLVYYIIISFFYTNTYNFIKAFV